MTNLISAVGAGEFLAIMSAIFFAGAQIFIRLGMRSATPLTAALVINTCVSAGGLALSLYRGTLLSSTWPPILWFVLIGASGPSLGRICYYISISRMGLGRSVTISSSTPLWSTLTAILLLGETPSPWVIVGTFGIVSGVALLARQEDPTQSFRLWLRGALIFPLIASVAYSLPPILAKMAYAYQQTPAVGMAVAFSSANVILLGAAKPLAPILGRITVGRKDFTMLLAAGLLGVMSSLSLWTAIQIGSVSTTMPLSRTAPFLVLILSYIFLRKHEPITRRMVFGTTFVVLGGVLITAFR